MSRNYEDHDYHEDTRPRMIMPEVDFEIPTPGGSKNPPTPLHEAPSGGSWKLALLKLPFSLLMLGFRHAIWGVVWLVLPFIATSLMISAATWYYYPAAFNMATGLLFNLENSFDLEGWMQQAEGLGENLPAIGDLLPPNAAQEPPTSEAFQQKPIAVHGELPATWLAPQPSP